MAVELSWYVEGIVFCVNLGQEASVEAATEINRRALDEFFPQGQAPVHELLDARNVTSYRFNIQAVNESSAFMRHPSMGWMVMVGNNNPAIRSLATLVTQVARIKFKMVGSMDEAHEVLRRIDARLQNTQFPTEKVG